MMRYLPSMVDGKISRLSVSQLSRFDSREKGGCKRKWWYRYVAKLPDPPSIHQQAGIDGHKRLELYFLGQTVALHDMDIPALAELPPQGAGALTEVQLENLTLLRIPFQGSMDLVYGNDVYDYKFQARIQAYAEPTVQLWGYLEEIRLRNNVSGRLGFHHVYISKKEPYKAKKVSQFFEAREVERNWLGYGSLVKEMQDVAAEQEAVKVEANPSACYAYGPCPYLSICSKNKIQEPDIMTFLEELEAAKKDVAVITIPEVAVIPDPKPTAPARPANVLKALPPDAPPADAVPPPEPTPSVIAAGKRGPGRPRKLAITAPVAVAPVAAPPTYAPFPADEVPDGRPGVRVEAPPAVVVSATKLKSMRFGLTLSMPEYSSIHAFAEMEGGTEDEMSKAGEEIVMRQIKKVALAYKEALKVKNNA